MSSISIKSKPSVNIFFAKRAQKYSLLNAYLIWLCSYMEQQIKVLDWFNNMSFYLS